MTATAIPTFHLTSANKARSMSDEELMLSLVKSFKPLPKTKREAIKGIMKLIKVDETYAAMALQVAARISQRGDLYGVWVVTRSGLMAGYSSMPSGRWG